MVNQATLDDRKKDTLTIDEVSTILWAKEMGERLSIVRMKMLKEQAELAVEFSVRQGTISKIETGKIHICSEITVANLKKALGQHFAFVLFGANPQRYNRGVIHKVYWDTRLRVRRSNKSAYSKSRIL